MIPTTSSRTNTGASCAALGVLRLAESRRSPQHRTRSTRWSTQDGRQIVRHHLLDFGSTLGSGSVQAQSRRAGNEFVWESRPTLDHDADARASTCGRGSRLTIRRCRRSADSSPPTYRPRTGSRTTRTRHSQAHGRRIASGRPASLPRLPDEGVAAVVEHGAIHRSASDRVPHRRPCSSGATKVLNTWLNGTNPIVNVALSRSGELTFENAAEQRRRRQGGGALHVQWSRFDNATGAHHPVGDEQTVSTARRRRPRRCSSDRPEYIVARLRAFHPDHPAWAQPLSSPTSAEPMTDGRSSGSSGIREPRACRDRRGPAGGAGRAVRLTRSRAKMPRLRGLLARRRPRASPPSRSTATEDDHFQLKYLPAFAVLAIPVALLPLPVGEGVLVRAVAVALIRGAPRAEPRAAAGVGAGRPGCWRCHVGR